MADIAANRVFLQEAEVVYLEFGNRLRQARMRAGFTQERLARSIGLKRTSITNLEAGTQHVTLHMLLRLCATLNVSPEALCPPISLVQPFDVMPLPEKYERMISIIRNAADK